VIFQMKDLASGDDRLPIVQYWHSAEIPAEVTDLIATFRDHNPDMRHMVFDETEAERFIAEHFTSREVGAFRSCAVPAMQSDYFRYCAVLTLGGVYSDADFRCLGPLRALIEETEAGRLFIGWRQQVINAFFLFKSPGHPLLRLALDIATANIEGGSERTLWKVTGPGIFSALVGLRILGPDHAAQSDCTWGLARSTLEEVGGYARVEEAFRGVNIAPFATVADWIVESDIPLQYKQGDTHWIRWQKQGMKIFR
jgi:mannosyltransferase OCH1-like enzyme